jgi:NAD(P)-dependent dehydrogenase (short-subunit alcohol dehydrogenase family)
MTDVTVVTGAGGALGAGVCEVLAAHGHRVVAVDRAGSEARLEALVASLGGGARSFVIDVGSHRDWAVTLERTALELGPVTGGVLCAGGWAGGAPLWEERERAYLDMTSSNLDTAHASLRALLGAMVPAKRGSVVVVGARPVERPHLGAGMASYAATKAAVVTLAQAAAEEARPYGVRVNAVLPSTLDTQANRAAMPDADPSRWVSVRSLAGVIRFLLGPDAVDVSGAAIPVYGRA